MSTALVWFRRDLRLADNPALHSAVERYDHIIPVYVYAPAEEAPWQPGGASRWWQHQSLAAFQERLAKLDSQLIIRRGPTLEALRQLKQETNADALYWNRLYEPAIIERDKRIKAAFKEDGVDVESFNAALLAEPWEITTQEGEPYKVFTPYWRRLSAQLSPSPRPVVAALPHGALPAGIALDELRLMPAMPWYEEMTSCWEPGEQGAWRRLKQFCEQGLGDYAAARDRPDVDGVSRLSPHLHHGEISPRQVWCAVAEACSDDPLSQTSPEAYLRELGWREFAHHVLYYWPNTPEQPLQTKFAHYPWADDYQAFLKAWQRGQTGIPLVDAGMRQLWRTGWLHNRIRMVVASFLVKNCRVPWQEGERWFWDCLVDADLANNTMGWQWTAGCGTDAAPYFRVFNPVRQGEQHDPQGEYVRRYVEELAELPNKAIHKPWESDDKTRQKAGVRLGQEYPEPIVDLKESRKAALAGYDQVKNR